MRKIRQVRYWMPEENRDFLKKEERRRIEAAAKPDRAPKDTGFKIGYVKIKDQETGTSEYILSENWEELSRGVTNAECSGRDTCLDEAKAGWLGLDCRECPHFHDRPEVSAAVDCANRHRGGVQEEMWRKIEKSLLGD